MVVVLDRKALEAPLPDMAMTTVMVMIAPHMTGHPPLHKRTERIVPSRLQHEMEMVRHETEAKHVERVCVLGNDEQIEEGPVIAVFVKDRRAAISTINDVVDLSGHLSSWNARHGRT